MRRFCLRSSPLTPPHISQNFHIALLLLTLQGDTPNRFAIVTGRKTKLFYFHWLSNLNFSAINLNFRRRKTPTT